MTALREDPDIERAAKALQPKGYGLPSGGPTRRPRLARSSGGVPL